MHIAFLTHEYPKKGLNGGGIGSFVQFLGRELVKNNITVSVIGINNSLKNEFIEDSGVKIYRLAKSKWKLGKFYQNTKRILKKINELEEVDIVEGSELSFAFFPKNTTYKKVIRLHGGHHFFAIELGKKPTLWKGFQEKRSFKKANAFVAVSDYVGMQTQKYLNSDFNFKIIHNSVNTEKFKPSKYSLEKKNLLLFIGTICEKKGIRQLVQAMPLIKKHIHNIKLKIVGRDWFFKDGGSYINYLKTFITKDVAENIEIIGAVSHHKIPELLAEAEVCVFPSHMEAMPIAWLEALSMGKKVLASNIGPGIEAIRNKETGLLINPYKPKEIAEGVLKLLNDNRLGNSIRINARKDILNRFNNKKIINQNISFYKKILL